MCQGRKAALRLGEAVFAPGNGERASGGGLRRFHRARPRLAGAFCPARVTGFPKMSGPADIVLAVDILRRGGLVALPTETVYGLAADAGNELAVRRIFA